MKFGATLEQSVADDWRGYAVDYSSLKLALKGQRRTAAGTGTGVGGLLNLQCCLEPILLLR